MSARRPILISMFPKSGKTEEVNSNKHHCLHDFCLTTSIQNYTQVFFAKILAISYLEILKFSHARRAYFLLKYDKKLTQLII